MNIKTIINVNYYERQLEEYVEFVFSGKINLMTELGGYDYLVDARTRAPQVSKKVVEKIREDQLRPSLHYMTHPSDIDWG